MNILLAFTAVFAMATTGQVLAADAGIANAATTDDSSHVSPAPGFNCARARSRVEHLVCGTPELAKLDAQLGDIFLNASGQAGLNARTLRHDEDQWLINIRGACGDVACLETVYEQRIAALKDQSLRAASPAAYAETRPFPTDPSLLANVKSYVGKSCDALLDPSNAANRGFMPIKGFLPVVAAGAMVRTFAKDQSRFAFLMATNDGGQCIVRDVVVLPGKDTANALLQCDSPDSGNATGTGIGMRLVGDRKVVAYWAIDAQRMVLDRLPLGVLGVENAMHCREPETGE